MIQDSGAGDGLAAAQHEVEALEAKAAVVADPAKAVTQVSDIEFRGETIYFIVVDRFCDGDPANSAGADEHLYDATHTDFNRYWGGDLEGVIQKLDYLQAIGVTAVWCTPLFEQVERLAFGMAPSHGYWAKDFKRINPRWVKGEEEASLFKRNDTTFDRLLAELHKRGMKFILDIVCNHSSPDTDGVKGDLYDDGVKLVDYHNDTKNWYHKYGGVTDWQNEWQVQNCELAGIATFNENNWEYRDYIKGAIKLWLGKGVDALRIDTVKHMPPWFWQEFTADMVSAAPDTFIFGEWIDSHPSNPRSVEYANHAGMSILDFGFSSAVRQALGQNEPKGFQLVQDVYDQDHVYRNATELVTFIDNHDMPRFQSLGADGASLRLAVVLTMTGRGIPCIYYGTEQYLHDDTNKGLDPYNRPMMVKWDTETAIAKDMAVLAKLRHVHPAMKFGRHTCKHLTNDQYVFIRKYGNSRLLVALNRGGIMTTPEIETHLPDGEHVCVITGRKINVVNGKTKLEMGPKDAQVYSVVAAPTTGKVVVRVQLNGYHSQPGQTMIVTGDAPELGRWNIEKAVELEYVNDNTWFGELVFDESAGKPVAYKFAALPAPDTTFLSIRENALARRRIVPESGIVKWRDAWER